MTVLATTIVNDGLNAAIVSGVLTLSASTQATGPFAPTSVLLDSVTATTMATIKKVNTTALAGDTALVVAVRDGTVTAVISGGTVTAQISGGTSFISGGTVTAQISGGTSFISGGNVTAIIASGTSFISGGNVTAVVSGTVTATATLTIAGAAVSSTNALFSNLTQNNATLTPTNGIWANVMFNNAIVSAGTGLPVNIVSGSVSVGNVTAALNQGGAALSSTNGIYGNVMFNNTLVSASVGLPVNIVSGSVTIGNVTAALNQGGAAISSTNGIFANLLVNNSLVSASSGVPATLISGATTVGVKGASITAVATDPSLVVQFNPQSPGIIPTGTFGTPSTTVLSVQGQTTGTPVPVSGPLTLSTTATPTLSTTTAYTATQVIGGVITFTAVLGGYTQGIIESITCKLNTGLHTVGLSVSIFKAAPSAGTYTDHVAVAINTADVPSLIGTYRLSTALSDMGNMAIYNLDGIGKAFQSSTSNVYGVVTALGTTLALGNVTAFSIELGVLPG